MHELSPLAEGELIDGGVHSFIDLRDVAAVLKVCSRMRVIQAVAPMASSHTPEPSFSNSQHAHGSDRPGIRPLKEELSCGHI